MIDELYQIRDYDPSKDNNIIYDTFLKGVYHGNAFFQLIPVNVFFANYRLILASIINNPNTIIKVACLKEDPEIIVGYSILGDNFKTVHYVYVKKKFRKLGVGKSLTPLYPESVTHLTALGLELLPKLNGAIFNPFY